ncbi:hypothetical protein AJ80_04019 [Polytolypa hystricis UAMH7299]|uniref:Zn(2)-C6 fungal-type domain-containing protein n=1 Tax=Polytolypa hystricis (strain UAMH7299) TaxID=1447883 RepID=A0A2B7YEQ5_POLH7|nr:hypothetical protein AJ80_04019 [Polytolypa hystricis UAMH7299]
MASAKPPRRQNRSCDSCRRSKRRCSLPTLPHGEISTVCANCERLGFPCTFNFARSRLESVRERRRRQFMEDPGQLTERNNLNTTVGRESEQPLDIQRDIFQGDSGADQEFATSWPQFDLAHLLDDPITSFPSDDWCQSASLTPSDLQITTTGEPERDGRASLLPGRSHTVQNTQQIDAPRLIIGNPSSSPILLLNSKLNATILDERLAKIYDTIVTGSGSRFLDYDCNIYVSRSHYRLGSGVVQHSHESRSTGLGNSNLAGSPIPSPQQEISTGLRFGQPETIDAGGNFAEIPESQEAGHKMTLLGSVRFLDHFSDLYGNKLDLPARKKSDEAMKTVLRVFALQWLPAPRFPSQATSSGNHDIFASDSYRRDGSYGVLQSAFTDSWFRARDVLHDALSAVSFRVVYAMLMFDGIAFPTKVSGEPIESVIRHEFLDAALQKLQYLDGLVTRYCANLGPSSKYNAALEASLNIARWCGYLRDTGAALAMDRQCKLADLASPVKVVPERDASTISWPTYLDFHPDLDREVSTACRKGVAESFLVWGQIINIKNTSLKPILNAKDFPSEGMLNSIASAMTAIGNLNRSWCPLMVHCMENFQRLSMSSRLSLVSFELFRNLVVLTFAEILNPLTDAVCPNGGGPLFSTSEQLRVYQQDAISSVARMVDCLLNSPIDEVFNLENGLSAEVPLLAYHVTPSLTATVLQKAIEQSIGLLETSSAKYYPSAAPLVDMDRVQDSTNLDGNLKQQQIDVLMKGLVSLDVTIGGSYTANVALQSLMRKYGDILSECWSSCKFDT